MNSNQPPGPPRVPPSMPPPPQPPPPQDAGGGRRQGIFFGGCALASLLALMALLVLGALIFLVVLSSNGGGGDSPANAPSPPATEPAQSPPATEPAQSPPATEPEYLSAVTEEEQIGPFTLQDWSYDTADATAAGAIDGVQMSYLRSDGTELWVVVWEFTSSDGASEDLSNGISHFQSEGYDIVEEDTVEVDGEEVGQVVLLSGDDAVVLWTNGVLSCFVQGPTEDYVSEFYSAAPY